MTSSPVRVSARAAATFAPTETSVSAARRLVGAALEQWGLADLQDEATLLVSELATNAIVHAGTSVDVVATLLAETVEVSVTDRHPARVVPAAPVRVSEDREGGRGLLLTAAMASAWGVDYTAEAKRVWFRLPLTAGMVPPPRGGDIELDAAPASAPPDSAVPGVATIRLDGDGLMTQLDDTAVALLGRSARSLVGKSLFAICHPDDTATLVSAAQHPRWQGAYQLRRGDDRFLRVHARHVRLPDEDGMLGGTVCVLVDHRLRILLSDGAGPVAATASPDGPFAHAPEFLVRMELDEVLDRTVVWARDALGGDGAFALLVTEEDAELEVRALAGLSAQAQNVPRGPTGGRWSRDRELLPVVQHDLTDGAGPTDDWLREDGMRSLVAVPIVAGGRLIGSIGVASARPAAFSAQDGARLQRAVDTVALAVQSARVAEMERRRHGWLGYLAEASELLAGTLELDMALALVGQLVAPQLGPWCAIHLVDGSGRSLPATVWHSDEEHIEDLRRLFDLVPAPLPPTERGVSRWLPVLDDSSEMPQVLDLARAGGHVVALTARGRLLGTLTVGHRAVGSLDDSGRQQLHLLGDLAPRAAMALDNARLYAERTATSDALQRSLLPPELPTVSGVEVGVVYEATGAGNEVGGDFYDIFGTPGGTTPGDYTFAFAVGDVCGKGPEAAAVTGLARHALRLLSRRGDGIEAVLGHLNEAILGEGSRARFITLIYGEGRSSDDGSLDLRFASAGHPAPVVVRRDGSAEAVGDSGDLLGVFDQITAVVSSVRLRPGESIVCFTDGVTERRSQDRMIGEEGVQHALRGKQDLSAAALARELGAVVANYTREPTRDDIAILALRAAPTSSAGGELRPPPPGE